MINAAHKFDAVYDCVILETNLFWSWLVGKFYLLDLLH